MVDLELGDNSSAKAKLTRIARITPPPTSRRPPRPRGLHRPLIRHMATEGHDLSAFDVHGLKGCADFRIGLAVAEWNSEITHALRDGALHVLSEVGVTDVMTRDVPGSFELPLACQWSSPRRMWYVIAVGSVIRGETAHFDYVCQAASSGVLQAGMEADKPAIFCVLTDDNIEQSRDRSGGRHGNKARSRRRGPQMARLRRDLSRGHWGIGLVNPSSPNIPFLVPLLVGLVLGMLAATFSTGYLMHDDHFLVVEVGASWAAGEDYNDWLPSNQTGTPEAHPGNSPIRAPNTCSSRSPPSASQGLHQTASCASSTDCTR